MKNRNKNLLVVLLAGIVISFTQCSKAGINEDVLGPVGTKSQNFPDSTQNENSIITNSASGFFCNCINSLPSEPLSASEITSLNTMREEELLAHDVYVMLYALFKIPVFNNISKAETQHAEAVKSLLLKYNLPDPAKNHISGLFASPDLQALYKSLESQGKASLTAALNVGATIEDIDINDLHNHIGSDVDNKDILFVFKNLEKGSRNHLRSFNRLLAASNVPYTPKFISLEYYNQIISNPHETGSVECLD